MIHNIIILILLLLNSKIFIKGINNDNDNDQDPIEPKEIIHGILQNDSFQNNKRKEYYINITDYELNEENIFEIYSTEWNIIVYLEIYTLLTNGTIEEIKNNTIKPTYDNIYSKDNSYKFDYLTLKYYFYMPFKKTSINQTFFIILISAEQYVGNSQEIFFSISDRIPKIPLIQKEEGNKILFSESLKAKNDIHLYYKFEIDKNINLLENNIFFFIDDLSIQIFSTNLSSSLIYNNNMFMIQKNREEITTVYLGLKNLLSKSINITINLDKNDIYILNGERRVKQKLYIEQINCKNKFYIIENYDDYSDVETKKFLIINKFYGNYLLEYYDSFKYNNFEFITEEKGIEITDKIMSIKGKLKIYSLNCITPTALLFELFSNEEDKTCLEEGKQIKSFLEPNQNSEVSLKIDNELKKYKFYIFLLDKDYRNITQQLNFQFSYRSDNVQFVLDNQNNKHDETIYYGEIENIEPPKIILDSVEGTFINYYLTSNRLFYKIEEGETIIDKKEMENLIFKINKNILFDYISFEVDSEFKKISINYELKIINSEYIDNYGKIMAPIPDINMPESNTIKLRFSNPYNKYDSIIEENDNQNYFYLLINIINIDINFPIYINIKYNYNSKIISLSQIKTEIINPENEYEIYADKNYINKPKILFNINKCDTTKNYLFINYYPKNENNNIIINEKNITKNREIILSNNIFSNSKLKIINTNNNNDTNNNNETINTYFPADYYNKGDIILNYFLVKEELYNELSITNNFSINYEDKYRANIILSWNDYIINNKYHFSTNYSIYILPNYSIINSMCQLSLIPSNYSVINENEIEIYIEEGNYKVAIIASIINKEFPITNIYDILDINVGKRLNLILIIVLSSLGLIIILIILFLLCRKKRKCIFFKRDENRYSTKIEENKRKINENNNNENDSLNRKKTNNSNNSNDEKDEKDEKDDLNQNLINNKIEMEEKVDENELNENNIDNN